MPLRRRHRGEPAAWAIMRRFNPNALFGPPGEEVSMIEDVPDDDGRWYRIEYRCAHDGSRAFAWLCHNPWGPDNLSGHDTHLMPNGWICTSGAAHRGQEHLDDSIRRARFWCSAYSFVREHGVQRARQVLGSDW